MEYFYICIHPMKRYLYLILLFLSFSYSKLYAQYGLQASIIAPTGYYSYVLKPTLGIELYAKIGDPDDYYSIGAAFGYATFKPTQDTFKTYAVGGQYNNLFPGYEVIHSYDELSIGVTNDFRILPDSKFCPVIGMDMYFYVIEVGEDDYTETIESYSTTGDDYWLLSFVPRVGAQYQINKEWYLSGFLGRSMSITGTATSQAFWKMSVSLTYYPF